MLRDFIGTNKVLFRIPVYQRNYDWSESNCNRLLDDIYGIMQSGDKHFLGTIVFMAAKSGGFALLSTYAFYTWLDFTLTLSLTFDLDFPQNNGRHIRACHYQCGSVFLPFAYFMERARNAAICARVQVAVGSKRPPPMPVVMPFSTAQDTACA